MPISKYERHPQKNKYEITPTAKKLSETLHIDIFFAEKETFLIIFDPSSKDDQTYLIPTKKGLEFLAY